jgi:hypothetical protein
MPDVSLLTTNNLQSCTTEKLYKNEQIRIKIGQFNNPPHPLPVDIQLKNNRALL